MKELIVGKVYVGINGDEQVIRTFESAHEAIKDNYKLWCSTGEDYEFSYRGLPLNFNDERSFQECISDLEWQIEQLDKDYIKSDVILQ